MKVLSGMALRRTTGFVESLLKLADLDWTVPDFSPLSRRRKTLAANLPYRGSRGPLPLLVDSRSRAGTKMHCVKMLGERLTARHFDRQVAEVQVRVAVLNGFTAPGMPVTKGVG